MAARAKAAKTKQPGAGRRHVTLRDVAVAAGVSPMTVSNFVNSRLSAMSADTRDRIQRVVDELGYRPHAMARNLRLARRYAIDMVIVDDAPHYLADPFTTHIVAGLSNHLNSQGYALQLQAVAPAEFHDSALVRNLRADGVCVLMSGSNATRRGFLNSLLGLGQPIVAFQESSPPQGADLCAIVQDDRAGGRLVARHVLERGPRAIAMLVPSVTWPAIVQRVAGVRDALRAAPGVAFRIVACGDGEYGQTQDALAADMAVHGTPDAVIAGNDQMGIAAMKLMAAKGLRVPADVAITGFNAFEFWQYTDPMLTTIVSPAYEMGARGAAELLARLSEGHFRTPRIVFPVTLQPGGST